MHTTGIALAVLSALFMGTIGVFSKITGLPAETITFFRLFLGASFLALFLITTRQARVLKFWPTWPVIINGGFLAGFIIFYVRAMNLTSMANAIMLVYLAPVAAAIIAHFWLNERLRLAGWLLIISALLGFAAMMEFRLDFERGPAQIVGLGCATLAMSCYAGFILVNRRIQPEVPVMTRAFYQLLAGAMIMLPFFWTSRPSLSWTTCHGSWARGSSGIFGHHLRRHRPEPLPAATFGTLAYFEPIAVIIFGWTLFDESLSPLQMAGCAAILASGCAQTFVARHAPTIQDSTNATRPRP